VIGCAVTQISSPDSLSDVFVDTDQRERLLRHPIYARVTSLEAARRFMQEHVFAVWDFMSLAKRLQQEVTCVKVPWLEAADPQSARFVNEIVLAEETDEDGRGGFSSHFELYRQAMQEVGASQTPIDSFIRRLRSGSSVSDAFAGLPVRQQTIDFVTHTLSLSANGQPHEVASAFCFGREDVIPDMFRNLLDSCESANTILERFRYYLDRHIEVDGDTHGPMARQLVLNLCGGSAERIEEARTAANQAIEFRIRLWDGILDELSDVG